MIIKLYYCYKYLNINDIYYLQVDNGYTSKSRTSLILAFKEDYTNYNQFY